VNLRRKLGAAAAVAALVAGGGLVVNVLTPSPAAAHGAQMIPGSRQFLCWENAQTPSGALNPTNPACQAWLNDAGTTPFYNWFADLNSFNNGATVGTIPDGRICDGNATDPFDFSYLNTPRNDWPYTRLTAGATVQFRHNNWAAHPGRFDVYITRQGWNPSSPLAWSDLELIDTAVDPPASGGPGGFNYYFWNFTLPSNRSGQHIIFTHWVRSDSPEDFFSCSDVRFDGGNGEVVFPGGGTQPPPSSQPPPPSSQPPPPSSQPPPPSSQPPPPSGDCTVAYDVLNDWGSGFQAEVTITNDSSTTITAWDLTWTFPSGQSITQIWNAEQIGSGASNVSWNGTIGANGGTVNFGFLGSPGGGGEPTAFSLNGTACAVA
jgi:predicted carbohydrate-binding protein with CBM5 and CBM33 domain